jgi:linoleoyl-CoA desaturase
LNRITFGAGDGFHSLLRARVHDHFESTGQERRDSLAMVVKSAVILGWFVLTYWLLVFQASNWPAAVAGWERASVRRWRSISGVRRCVGAM